VQPGRGWFPLLSPLELVQHQLFGLNAALVAFAGVYRSNDENQTSLQNLGLGPRPHRSGSESALGKSQGTAEGVEAWQTNHVHIGSTPDRSGATSTVEDGSVSKEIVSDRNLACTTYE
jgi:hypothetical protein